MCWHISQCLWFFPLQLSLRDESSARLGGYVGNESLTNATHLGSIWICQKRPFAATRQWRIFIHRSLQNVHEGLFYPHSEGTIGQSSGLSNQSFDRLCEYTRRTFQFNGATASEIDWAKWTTQRFYSPGRFQHFDKKRGIIILCLTREIFTRNLFETNYKGGQGLKISDYLKSF